MVRHFNPTPELENRAQMFSDIDPQATFGRQETYNNLVSGSAYVKDSSCLQTMLGIADSLQPQPSEASFQKDLRTTGVTSKPAPGQDLSYPSEQLWIVN